MKKRILLFLALLWLVISFLMIKTTYAKYLSSIDSNANISISAWRIKLNTQDVMDNSDFTQNVNLIFPGDNYYTADTIVPGALGYFDLVVDTSEIALGVRYTVTTEVGENSDIPDAKIVGYSFPGQQNYITYLENSENSVSSSSAASVNTNTIRIYVSWNDNPNTETLNDSEDTQIATTSGKAILKANVLFEQLVN